MNVAMHALSTQGQTLELSSKAGEDRLFENLQ